MNILDSRFKYTKAIDTDVSKTFKRFGLKPVTQAERDARQKPKESNVKQFVPKQGRGT